jgi:hypothetical protein
MRFAVLAVCLLAGAVNVYPEAALSAASRTTGITPTKPAVEAPPLLTIEQVNGWVKRWQQRLGLSAWKIEAKIVRLSQLPKGTVANIHWSLPRKTASIRVLDSIDSNLPKHEIARDTELSVVHELVHLSMAKLPLDANNTELEEEAVKKISVALMALDRGDEQIQVARKD